MGSNYYGQAPSGGPAGWPPPTASVPERRRGGWRDFLLFRSMLTPALITVLWVLGAAGMTIATVVGWIDRDQVGADTGEELAVLVGYLIAFVILQVLYRAFLELVVVIFRVHDRLIDIDRNTRPR